LLPLRNEWKKKGEGKRNQGEGGDRNPAVHEPTGTRSKTNQPRLNGRTSVSAKSIGGVGNKKRGPIWPQWHSIIGGEILQDFAKLNLKKGLNASCRKGLQGRGDTEKTNCWKEKLV